MAAATAIYKELRFVIEDELTQAYVAIEAVGDCPLGVQGWHHKTFPKTKAIDTILSEMFDEDNPVLWPLKAPERA